MGPLSEGDVLPPPFPSGFPAFAGMTYGALGMTWRARENDGSC